MNNYKKITFIITSVIYFKEKKLSYADKRSSFSTEDRIKQTEKTISSIKESLPDANIVLVEAGLKKDIGILPSLVDQYLYVGDRFLVRMGVDSIFKGIGEAVILLSASNELPKDTDFYFKISGRYYLNEEFDITKWLSGLFVVRTYGKVFSTRLYGFSNKMFGVWKRSLLFSIPILVSGQSIERIMPLFIPKKYITHIDNIGVSGLGSVYGDIQKD